MGMTHFCRWLQPFLAKDIFFTIQAALFFGGIYLCAGETSVLVEYTILSILSFFFWQLVFEG